MVSVGREKEYQVGDKPRCTGTLKTATGTLTNSTEVYAWVRNPAGAVTTYHYGAGGDNSALVRLSTGIYYIDVTVDMPGEWSYGFYSTGNAQGASPDTKMNVLETVR